MSTQDSQPAFKRILLKLSGEALMGDDESGIDTGILAALPAKSWNCANSAWKWAW